ncbi:EAL domain-containing protein [Sulfurisoma sediminicola]|uniref:Diguanylate cyclase (GGDEF)-like protein n=1 Tax=Sulfurisoma sediminicola TaxID=1381557 RepID=A0A497XLE5_9PROT|nr:EAL domain-containing protein [Sulfurisoma sediminicola]RLJ68135.1 diguanylate cyclase (GGDEF)-like protein [Sulfurisoma sediminicola]
MNAPVPTALIVDDDELMRMMLAAALAGLGLEVHEAGDGETGLEAFNRLRPDLVLLDLLMPGIDGIETCRRLRRRPDARTVPIVMITGQDDRESIDLAFAAGATDFFAKPINWQMLPHRIRFILHAAQALRDLTQSEARQQQAQRLAGLGSFEYLIESRRFYPSANLPALLGLSGDDQARLRQLMPAFNEDDWKRMLVLATAAMEGGDLQTTEVWTLSRRCMRVQIQAVEENGTALLRGSVLDVTDLRSAQAQADWLTRHDPLTGMHNRPAFSAVLEREAAVAGATGRLVPVLLLSLDRMRRARDSLGQEAADRILVGITERLRAACATFQPVPELARITTDELCVLFRHAAKPEEIADAAEHLIEALQAPFDAGGQPFHLQPAGGLALFPQDGDSCQATVKAARAALLMEGAEGRALHFYDADRDRALTRRLRLEEDLRGALAAGQLAVHYQPLVRVRDCQPVGVEALLRWQHPEHGDISPVEFIPIAEEAGFIGDIGAWVLRTACTQAMAWLGEGIALEEVAVNVSGRQLADPDFTAMLSRILAETGLPPARLVLELTESVLVHDDEAAVAQLHGLKALGLRLALDDFGTGFSSMVSLTRLPLDVIKVDRSFVQAAPTDRAAAAVVEAILALAGRLGMDTVAEGVEDAEHFDILGRFGCTTAQGFMFQRPQSAADVVQHLRGTTARPPRVVIVDDSRVSRLMLRKMILAHQPTATVIEVDDALTAVDAVTRERPDLVTLDNNMPGRTGLEIAAELRQRCPELDMALLTANFQDAVVAEARRLGLRFLAKPITEALVGELLAGCRRPR